MNGNGRKGGRAFHWRKCSPDGSDSETMVEDLIERWQNHLERIHSEVELYETQGWVDWVRQFLRKKLNADQLRSKTNKRIRHPRPIYSSGGRNSPVVQNVHQILRLLSALVIDENLVVKVY